MFLSFKTYLDPKNNDYKNNGYVFSMDTFAKYKYFALLAKIENGILFGRQGIC